MSNKQKIEVWFEEYSDDIYQFLLYRLGTTDVEDMVQEVFIKALRGIHRFKGDSAPKTWLYSIARNVALDELRRRKRNQWKSLLLFETASVKEPATSVSPETLYFLSEEQKQVVSAIYSLKSSYQEVLIMRGIKELSVQETATVLGWTEKKVRSTHYRAKLALQEMLGGDQIDE